MISRRIIINLFVFFGLAALLIGYGAISLLGNPFSRGREISTVFPDASGLRPDFSASYNGVIIGVVKKIELTDGDRGVKVTIGLDKGVRVPGNVEARVIRASPVGEQRIDLVPREGGTTEPLANHAVVPAAPQSSPPVVSEVVDTVVTLLRQIPAEDLNTVVHEAAVALRGRSDDLRLLVEATDRFSNSFLEHEQGFRQLLASAPPLLDATADVGPELRSALARTRVLTDVLAQRRDDLVTLVREGSRLGVVGNDVLGSQKSNLACIISDLADLNRLLGSPATLANLDTGLALNTQFFGPIDKIAPTGPAIDLGLGAPARNGQVWLRVRTLLPPGQPPASSYNPKRPTPATRPGAACRSEFGNGVGPASQADPEPPAKGGSIDPPSDAEAMVTPGPDSGTPLRAVALRSAATTPARPDRGSTTPLAIALGGLVLVIALRPLRPWVGER
jgi:virulence factor Mce-like protein